LHKTPKSQEKSMKITLDVNGRKQHVDMAPETPLLYALRNDLKFNGPKFGCGLAQCGACTVHLEGQPIRSCVTPVSAVAGEKITTIEGIGNADQMHPVQAAFIAEQAGQCGYCLSGMVMTATALLAANKNPSDTDIRAALNGNLCRCGSHLRIMRAVKRAAATMRGETV
jgi:nicotinate dehydrogenase subunit A